ncbi:Protein cortex [Eumeta japonica]|uniref:Protein cortex n=1 Tax=Eumeta variegata TaxID=151549 RepID=A0A4C2AEY1_EUMVA|nr:Protein cortex [Eumeta japonica]
MTMDREVFGQKPVNCDGESDRFVRGRAALEGLRARLALRDAQRQCSAHAHDIWYPHYLYRKRYMTYLDQALDQEDLKEDKPLHSKVILLPKSSADYKTQHWPCVPRRKSYLSSADSVLDLPSYRHSPCKLKQSSRTAPLVSDVLDWGGRDVLVAALGREYYKWSWRSQSLVGRGEAHALVNVCKFDPTGNLLTLGTVAGTVEVHHMEWKKRVARHRCECAHAHRQVCALTTLHWSPTGNAFVS